MHQTLYMTIQFTYINAHTYICKVEEKIKNFSLIRDQRTKKQGTELKICETRKVPYACKYTSQNLSPNSVLVLLLVY